MKLAAPPIAVPDVDPMVPQPFRVLAHEPETHDTFTLRLQPEQSDAAFPFRPGQFTMLYTFGTGECAISISGDPSQPETLVHTIRRVGTVTGALEALEPGDHVGVRGPFGTSWPLDDMKGRDLIFLAGGIGLAPLRPAIYHALSHRDDFGRIIVLAGARNPVDLLYETELAAWAELDGIDAALTVDHAGAGWNGHVGVVTQLIEQPSFDPGNAAALVCGPEIMMRFGIRELQNCGLPRNRIHLTMERNMKCAIGFCGHCQFGPEFICRDGPVFRYERLSHWFAQREL